MTTATDGAGTRHSGGGSAGSLSMKVLIPYLIWMAAMFASAVVLSVILQSVFFWLVTLLGAVVIGTLMSSAVVPELRTKH